MIRLCAVLFLVLFLCPPEAFALSLQEGLRIVTRGGRDVMIAQSDEDAARASVSLARSPWRPFVDLYGRETWLRYQPEAKTPFGAFPTAQDQFLTYGVKATQLLYDFGKTTSAIDTAKYALQSKELETRIVTSGSALGFILAYLDLLEAEKLVTVSHEDVVRYEAHRKDAESRFRAGITTKNEVLQADVILADARQRLLTGENQRSLKESKINSLLLQPLNEPVLPEEITESPAVGLTLEEAWSTAEASRSKIKRMDALISSKEERVRATQAEYLPTLYLSGGYEYSENQYLVHEDNWSLIAGVNVNLFSGGASRSKTGMERAELRSMKLSRDKVVDEVRLEVKGAYLDLQSSTRKIDVAKAAVAQAEENLRLQRLRYREGVGTATEVLDAVTLLSTAETNSWKALYGMKRAEAAFFNAAGKDLVEIYGK